LESKILTEH